MTRLKFERMARSLSQTSVAAVARIPQPALSQIERGRLLPTTAQMERLSAALNLSPDDLLKEVVIERAS